MEHSEHRKRILGRFCRGERLEDHELLEILLFFSRPRVNTNEIAHSLIDNSGSLREVFCESEDKLKNVDGIGDRSAQLIRIVSELIRRYNLQKCNTSALLSSEEDLGKYLCALFDGEYEEKVYMLSFSRSKKFISCGQIGDGLLIEGQINVIKATDKARDLKAAYAVIAHNHPKGVAAASNTDIETAKTLDRLFANVGVKVFGHYVVAGGKYKRYGET